MGLHNSARTEIREETDASTLSGFGKPETDVYFCRTNRRSFSMKRQPKLKALLLEGSRAE